MATEKTGEGQKEEADLQLTEQADGSVIVGDLPADDKAGEAGDGQEGGDATGGEAGQPADEADDAELAAATSDDEREQIREARRAERKARKQAQREQAARKDREIEMLREQVVRLQQAVGGVSVQQQAQRLGQVKAAINQLNTSADELKAIIASEEATAAQRAEATDRLFEVRQRAQALEAMHDRAVQQFRRPQAETDQAATAQARPDPRLVQHANAFMAKHKWFKLDSPEVDARVARSVDEALFAEGWDPTTREYWEELEERLQKYLPHRFSGYNPQKSRPNAGGGGAPRGAGGSGRSSDGTGGRPFTLSPERVNAMREAGMWDDPVKRAKAIKRYQDFDRSQQAGK